jgi:hypothetical protein
MGAIGTPLQATRDNVLRRYSAEIEQFVVVSKGKQMKEHLPSAEGNRSSNVAIELDKIADDISALTNSFLSEPNRIDYLPPELKAKYTAWTVRAKTIIDSEFGSGNEFTRQINLHASNRTVVSTAYELVVGAAKELRRRASEPAGNRAAPVEAEGSLYISLELIDALSEIQSQQWDLKKLVQLCRELNGAFARKHYMTTAMLVRAILDHVPPIFNAKNFEELANSYSGNGASFKKHMLNLQNSSRNVADGHLHKQIRASEVLPTELEVSFQPALGELLGEIVRKLNAPAIAGKP